MLMEIKRLLEEREQMTLADLARHFYVSEQVMLSMLDQWLRKGKVEKIDVSGICGSGCGSCDESEESKTIFRWRRVAQKNISVKPV